MSKGFVLSTPLTPALLWLQKNRLWGGNGWTHLALDGGKFSIKPADEVTFLTKVGSSLQRGHALYFIELRTDVFRFFLDVDKPPAGSEGAILAAVLAINGGKGVVVVCRAGDNWHVHFPNLHVDTDTASRLADDLAEQLGGGVWRRVVDPCVYKSAGLRLLGCRKSRPCTACHSKGCAACHNKGKEDLGRVYSVTACYRDGVESPELLAELQGNIVRALLFCSIRLPNTRTAKPTLQLPPPKKVCAPKVRTVKAQAQVETWLLRIVRGFHPLYAQVGIVGVKKMADHLVVSVNGPGSKACLNLGGQDHKSNSVYFVISRGDVCQKCFCRCETTAGRKYGKCAGFRSSIKLLEEEETELVMIELHMR